MRPSFILAVLVVFLSFLPDSLLAQREADPQKLQRLISVLSDLEFHYAVEKYVRDRALDYAEFQIPQERYLIQLMRFVNREMARRLKNPTAARKKYFDELRQMLAEIREMKDRLKSANIRELDTFVEELEKRIEATLQAGEVDFRKKKVFEDALQMLYVSEEMIRVDMSRSPETQGITSRISQTKQELMEAFGEYAASPETAARPVSIFQLFREWQLTNQLRYEARLQDVKLLRIRLLKTSTPEQILTMFRDELRSAIENFNYGDYDLAERLFSDLIETYPRWGIQQLDDVYFYRAEAAFALERFQQAMAYYEDLLNQYPATEYLPRTYARLVQIYSHLQQYDRALEYGLLYQSIAVPDDPMYYDIVFLSALASDQLGNVNQAVDLFLNIPRGNPYYHIAQYLIGNIYARSQLWDDAEATYLSLIQGGGAPAALVYRSYYKLAILQYERQNYPEAISYLRLIPETYAHYDKILNALAWSYFQLARTNQEQEVQGYALADYYANRLVQEYPASPFTMEAYSLLAYIRQLTGQPENAINRYRDVYQAKQVKQIADEFFREKMRLQEMYREARRLQELALQKESKEGYLRAERVLASLKERIHELEMSERSPVGAGLLREIARLGERLQELQVLRKKAELEGNQAAIQTIDSLSLRIALVLESLPLEQLRSVRYVNPFDESFLSYALSKEQSLYNRLAQQRAKNLEEIARIDELVGQLEVDIREARLAGRYALMAQLQRQQANLLELRKRLDALLSSSYQIEVDPQPYPEFDKWADIGAFGIINVHFEEKRKAEERLLTFSSLLQALNEDLAQRKKSIEDRIKKIDAEIRFMTMRVRMEERKRRRAERERVFREEFFDTRPGEVEEEPR